MTIDEAVMRLLDVKTKHGGDGTIELFFDCPYCLKVFVPGVVVAVKERVRAKFGDAVERREG